MYLHTTELRGREKFFVEYYEPPVDNFIDMDTTNKMKVRVLMKYSRLSVDGNHA